MLGCGPERKQLGHATPDITGQSRKRSKSPVPLASLSRVRVCNIHGSMTVASIVARLYVRNHVLPFVNLICNKRLHLIQTGRMLFALASLKRSRASGNREIRLTSAFSLDAGRDKIDPERIHLHVCEYQPDPRGGQKRKTS